MVSRGDAIGDKATACGSLGDPLGDCSLFVATKLEAFRDRGKGDILSSPDLEDIISVVDGRDELVSEVRGQSAPLRAYVGAEMHRLLGAGLLDALPGYVLPDGVSQARIALIHERLEELASFT